MRCPNCGHFLRLSEFIAAHWCSDAPVPHQLCRECQEAELYTWALRLAQFFMAKYGREAA